jgi:osmoprotectant transport system permease protein
MKLYAYIINNMPLIFASIVSHLQLTLISILIAIAIGVPLGILISYIKPIRQPILGLANVVQAVPSIALLGFLVPFLGIGEKPAVFMVVVYSLLPIIKNTATGLSNINQETVEAAEGIGMTHFQILIKIKLPLALPVIMAGVRISAVTSVGLVTLAAFIGAGGLGYLIYSGIRTVNTMQILSGAIPACILALLVDLVFSIIENLATPACFRTTIKGPVNKNKGDYIYVYQIH